MATVTKQIASFQDESIRFEIEYDDVTLRISALRCINNSGQAGYGELIRQSDGLVYGQRFGAGTTFISIPTNSQATRMQFTIDPERPNHFLGFEARFMFPYP